MTLVITRGAAPNRPRRLMIPAISGFHSISACSASFAMYPDTTSGGGSNTSGIALQMSMSPRIFHFDTPPMCGELNPKTTRRMRVSRIAYEQKVQGSAFIDLAVFKAYGTEHFLRLRNGRHFGMSRHIAGMRDPVDRLGHDHAIAADHCGIWILTRFAGCLRKADAVAHHQAIDCLNVHTHS